MLVNYDDNLPDKIKTINSVYVICKMFMRISVNGKKILPMMTACECSKLKKVECIIRL